MNEPRPETTCVICGKSGTVADQCVVSVRPVYAKRDQLTVIFMAHGGCLVGAVHGSQRANMEEAVKGEPPPDIAN